ncbi:MAG: tetratricopeptide repeat protein [Robiginitomaculum sp.]|nr:tetratricopeptide repeat protein [Robiginitomaculum sp.]MDQ7077173.1 tetratricopeptide repeat protein [Robiginitomaculum sp.]
MRCLNLALALSLISALPAYAGLRDAVLSVEGDAALSLVRFDRQPENVTVQTRPAGVEMVIQGVSAQNTRITPPDSHLVSAIDIDPIDGGVRLMYYFRTVPIKGSAEVYDHAVMLRVNFDHPLHAQNARLTYKAPPSPGPVQSAAIAHQDQGARHQAGHQSDMDAPSSQSTPQEAATAAQGQISTSPAEATNEATGSSLASASSASQASPTSDHHTPSGTHAHIEEKKPLHDGDVTTPPKEKNVYGTGMIRDASARYMAKGLDAASCEAAQQAIEDDPWALDKLSVYGACIAKEGRKDEAKEVFERLLTFDPEMISAYMGLGAIAQDSGDVKAAKEYYQQALKAGGSDAQAAQIRALLGTLEEKH